MPIVQNINKDPKYFTAVLQLRFLNEEIANFLRQMIADDKQKNFISKEEAQPNGIDFYVSSNKIARKAGKVLVEKYGGTLSENERLFSFNRVRSQNIYRMNILIEFPLFVKNDVIRFNKKVYLVKNIGKNINLTNLATGKDTIIQYKNIKEVEIMKRIETRVARTRPLLSVFDEDNQMVDVANQPKEKTTYKIGEKVKVVFAGQCYIVG